MAAYKAIGYGNNSTSRNVFGIKFSTALSAVAKIYCYDNDLTFPTVDTVETVDNIVLAGTTGHTESMVCMVGTTGAAPPSAWKPTVHTDGMAPLDEEGFTGVSRNRMRGTESYIQQGGTIRGAGERITFNMCVEVPHNTLTTDPMGFDVKVLYSYTGDAPTVTWQIYQNAGSPDWQDIAVSTGGYGILHCRAGSGPTAQGGDNLYYSNIPAAGTEVTAEGWADVSTVPA